MQSSVLIVSKQETSVFLLAISDDEKVAPPKGFDPPIGRPGILTDQPCAGRLSLQRKLRRQEDGQEAWFDHAHGYGWRLLVFDHALPEQFLDAKARSFFVDKLGGRVASITKEEDYTGDYSAWFDSIGKDTAILVRPDFYVYGYAAFDQMSELVLSLQTKLMSL